MRTYWNLLARHIRPQRGRFVLLSLLLLTSIGLQVANPQILRYFIDQALGGGAAQGLALIALAFIGIALVQQGVSIGVTYLGESVAWTATNALRAELAWHCLNLDMDFHNQHTPGELIERIDGDVGEMASFFSQFVILLAGNTLLVVGILAALFLEDWRAGLVFLLLSLVTFFILSRLRGIAISEEKAMRQADAELFGFIEEQLNATEEIRSLGAVEYSLRELSRLHGSLKRYDGRARRKIWILNSWILGLLTAAMVALISTGYSLHQVGVASVGTVYLFINYMLLLENPIWALTRQLGSFQTIGACVERLDALRQIQPRAINSPTGNANLPEGALAVNFDRVSFAYQTGEPVLKDLTFRLAPGGVLGVLGRTGSGKTTLTRLLFRLYEVGSGRIQLGGLDLGAATLPALRRRIGIVTQEVQLFRASVRDNLTLFDSSIPDARLAEALDELGLGDWLHSLPAGLDTELAAGGKSLSAGEAQLLAFARIFLRDPGLVILDEASSRLDPATGRRIEQAVDLLLRGRTAIVIAHRLETVQRCQEILILEQGLITEAGRREELAADPTSRFAGLLRTGLEEVLA